MLGLKIFAKKPVIELKAIPLSRQPDLSANNNVGAAFSETTSCIYYFLQDSGDIGKLVFKAIAYRAARTDCQPYRGKDFSFILEVVGSNWASEMDNWVYFDSLNAPWFLEAKKRVKHYMIAGNDIYHEFLADTVTEEYVAENCNEYRLALHILGGKP